MLKRHSCAFLAGLLLAVLLSPSNAGLSDALTHHWTLDEAGPPYIDRIGGADATCTNCPQSVEGIRGGALLFDGINDEVLARADDKWDWGAQDSFTMAYWIRTTPGQASQSNNMVALARQGTGSNQLHWWIGCQVNTWRAYFQLRDRNRAGSNIVGTTALNDGEWHLVMSVRDESINQNRLYVDTQLEGTLSWDYTAGFDSDDPFTIGHIILSGHNYRYPAVIDEVMVWERALTESDIRQVYVGSPGLAVDPFPPDAEVGVPRDVALAWTPGEFASTHDVYFGRSFDNVDSASVTEQKGVLLGQGLDINTCDPERLEFDTTYYWRVDEVNGPPEHTVYKGDVWSFKTEPLSYLITSVRATASSSVNGNSVPSKMVDRSGLTLAADGSGEWVHGTEEKTMWQSATPGLPATVAFEFNQAYKVHQMKIWNHNTSNESSFGVGAKEVTIEIADSNEGPWTPLADVTLTKAAGADTLATDTISMQGTMARNVRLTIRSNHGGFVPTAGLAEVQFFYLPLAARELKPVDGTALTGTEVTLAWRSGREAAEHWVYMDVNDNMDLVGGSNPAALAATLAADGPYASYTASGLILGQTYLWKIAEVNAAETPAIHESPVLSFTTPQFELVDDMESYKNVELKEIWATWLDGTEFGTKDPTNGSIVGLDPAAGDYNAAPGRNGGQSLPIWFTNTAAAPKSEAIRTSPFGDWTAHGIKSVSLWFYGDPTNSGGGQLYVKINNSAPIYYDGDPAALTNESWQPFHIDLSKVSGALTNVTKLAVGIDGVGATGVIRIDDVRLYPSTPE